MLLDAGRKLKIGDFGLARELQLESMTADAGTRPFTAPEVCCLLIPF